MKLYSVNDCENFDIDTIHDHYRRYVNASRVNLLGSFGFGNDVPDYSEGAWITLKNGRKILDFTGGIGVLNHGHNHPRILAARKKFQDEKRMEIHRNYFSKYIAALSHNLAQLLPGDLNYSFFPNSGAEAVDAALKTAFKFHDLKRDVILHSNIAFHGKLFGGASVTVSPENHYPFPRLLNCHPFEYNDIDSVRKAIASHRKANNECNVAGLILEPMNVSNMKIASPEFLKEVRRLCTAENIVLIYDEVYSGWCKTGPLFNFMRVQDAIPDCLIFAKSFGGAKSSISGIVTSEKIFKKAYDNVSDANIQTTTFYAFGEETITALEAVNIIVEENYSDKSQAIGEQLYPALKKLQEKYPNEILDVRGMGALYGVFLNKGPRFMSSLSSMLPGELFNDPRFMEKLVTAAVVSHLYDEHGLLTFTSLGYDVHLIVSAPLIVSPEEIDIFVKGLDETIGRGLMNLVLKFAKRRMLGR